MAKETASRIEQMKKNQQKLREILARDHEEHCEQMAQMMWVIMRMARKKRTIDDISFVNTVTQTQRVIEDLVFLFASFTMLEMGTSHYLIPPMANAVLETYPPMPSKRMYTYPYKPPLVILNPPIVQAKINSTTLFA